MSSFEDAMDIMSGVRKTAESSLPEESYEEETVVDCCELNADSSSVDILNYIMLYLCKRIERRFVSFKGGFVLTQLIKEARRTTDIDFSISEKGQYEIVKDVLDSLGKELVSKGVFIGYEIKENITETSSGGIKFEKPDGSKSMGIDIGLHTLSYGVQEWEYKGYDCLRFEFERMLSDKISAIYSPKRFRRTKDLYDFYIITSNFDIDMDKLREYITLRDTIKWEADPFREEVLVQYAIAYDKLNLIGTDGYELSKPKFDDVIAQLSIFMRGYNDGSRVWNFKDRKFD